MRKTAFLLIIAAVLAGCGSDAYKIENSDSSIESSSVDSKETKPESEVTSIDTKSDVPEAEEQETSAPAEVIWETRTFGHMSVEVPVSWASSVDESYASYIPYGLEQEYLGYLFSVAFYQNPNSKIEYYVNRDLGDHPDASVEELEIAGYNAARVQYERTKDDKEEIWINYYVQIYPESGLGIFSYIAPASDPELYREDYERIVNSLTADSDGNQEANAHTYVLNRSTGVFHKPSCYKVKQIEDAENIEGTAEDLIAQGYSGCGICNPR